MIKVKAQPQSCDVINNGIVRIYIFLVIAISFAIQGCAGLSSPQPQGRFENTLKEGIWEYFYPGGALWAKCRYQKGVLQGAWTVYFPDGSVQEKGGYHKGERTKDWEWFYPEGARYIKGSYKFGQKQGMWESNTPDGKPWWSGAYQDDKKTGKWIAWRSGQKVASGNFYKGRRHGVWNSYDAAGRIQYKGLFAKGDRTGIWQEFDIAGREIQVKDDVEGSIPGETDAVFANFKQINQKIKLLRRQLPPTFRLYSAGPFVVASELPRYVTDTYRAYTITWLHDHMMRDYCRTPPKLAEKTIFLFLSQRSYNEFIKKHLGRSLSKTWGVTTKQAILVDIESGSGSLVHELVHNYLKADFPKIPDWLEEGISSLYEQSVEVDGRITGLINFRIEVFRKAMQKGGLISLKDLILQGREKLKADELDLYYAQVRYFCFYLQELGVLQNVYHSLRDDKYLDTTGQRALMQILGADSLSAIQRNWISFISELKM